MANAEQMYRAAFERLKKGEPVRVPKGLTLSQNLVAKEAGADPSALKKSRFPNLIAEIQLWVSAQEPATKIPKRDSAITQREKNRSLREKINDLTIQRDMVCSKLVEADAKILELTLELEKLRKSPLPPNVSRLR